MKYRRWIGLYRMERERLGMGTYIIVPVILTLINGIILLSGPIESGETVFYRYNMTGFISLVFLYVILFANQLKRDFRGPWYILHTYPLSTLEIVLAKILAFFSVFAEAVLYTQLVLLITPIYKAMPEYWVGIIVSPLANTVLALLMSGIVILLSRLNAFPEILFAGYLIAVVIYGMMPGSKVIFALLPTLQILQGRITSYALYGMLGYTAVFLLSVLVLSVWKGVKFIK